MSNLHITKIDVIGQSIDITCTDWEVYSRKEGGEDYLLFRSLKDTEHKRDIHFVPKYVNGKLYEPSDGMYARCRVWFDDKPSAWFNILDTCKEPEVVDDNIVHTLQVENNILTKLEVGSRVEVKD